jgi:small subunit ribosomal protein S12e
VRALCFHNDIPILEIENRAELGKLVGQCAYDKTGNARKISGCSVAVVTNFGKDSSAADEVEKRLHKKNATTKGTEMEE